MEAINLTEIASCLGTAAKNVPNVQVTHISTDSRKIEKDCLFIAIEGERFDGHAYVQAAIQAGAVAAVVHKPIANAGAPLITVANTQKALLQIAAFYLSKFNLKKVAITGSVGKTTTKDMIACVVAAQYNTLKTEGNENNEIGVPRTLFRAEHTHQAAVLEFGMSGFGEIEELTLAAKPDIGVITNIGVSHIEHLGSRENILKAKLELTKGLPDGAPLFLCGDNDLLATVQDTRLNIIFYAVDNPNAQLKAQNIQEYAQHTQFTIAYQGQSYEAQIPCIGRHNVYNALCAFGVGMALNIAPQLCIQALQNYLPSGMRQSVVRHGDITLVKDCYNASPDSMRAALTTLAGYSCTGRKIAVLGDMLELGAIARAAHEEIGILAAKSAQILLAFGEQSLYSIQAAKAQGMQNAVHFTTKQALAQHLQNLVQSGDVCWFKASRGMKLEDVIDALEPHLPPLQ